MLTNSLTEIHVIIFNFQLDLNQMCKIFFVRGHFGTLCSLDNRHWRLILVKGLDFHNMLRIEFWTKMLTLNVEIFNI